MKQIKARTIAVDDFLNHLSGWDWNWDALKREHGEEAFKLIQREQESIRRKLLIYIHRHPKLFPQSKERTHV